MQAILKLHHSIEAAIARASALEARAFKGAFVDRGAAASRRPVDTGVADAARVGTATSVTVTGNAAAAAVTDDGNAAVTDVTARGSGSSNG